jgi:undecaprenyl-diphosphatase
LALAALSLAFGSETEVTLYFQALREAHPLLTRFMQLFTDSAKYALYAAFVALFSIALRKRDAPGMIRVLAFALVQMLVAGLLVHGLKIAIGSPRPFQALIDPAPRPFSPDYSYHSFPSGHTTDIVSAAGTLAVWRRRRWFSLGMGLLVALVGCSRIYLSQHHVIDVVAGMATGSLASLIVHYLCSREYRYDKLFRHASQ